LHVLHVLLVLFVFLVLFVLLVWLVLSVLLPYCLTCHTCLSCIDFTTCLTCITCIQSKAVVGCCLVWSWFLYYLVNVITFLITPKSIWSFEILPTKESLLNNVINLYQSQSDLITWCLLTVLVLFNLLLLTVHDLCCFPCVSTWLPV